MKNILLLIFLFLMFLLGAKNTDIVSPEREIGVECTSLIDVPVGYILPLVTEFPEKENACLDTESLARQYRLCGRGQRSFSVQHLFFGKSMAYRAAKKHLDMLCHTIKNVYTSLPFQAWTVASDHYVFRLRHILI